MKKILLLKAVGTLAIATMCIMAGFASVSADSDPSTTVFYENFGTGGTDGTLGNGWSDGGLMGNDSEKRASGSGNDSASPDGGRFGVIFGPSGWICRTIDTTGYTSAQLSYFWRGDGDSNSGSDDGVVEMKSASRNSCSDSSGWSSLQNHDMRSDSSWWTQSSFSHSGMDDTTFLLRFRTDTNQNDEHFRVDGIRVSGIATVTNVAPVAQALALSVNDNTASSSFVVATDVDVPAQTLTYSVVSNPSNGDISGFDSATGAFTYTPDRNYVGSDSFTFKANDGTLDSNTATVSITVNAYNERPVVTLIGPAYLLYTVGFPWVDQGATAMDEEDGDLTEGIVRTGDLDMNTVGEYTLTYSVTDSGRPFPPEEESRTLRPVEGLTGTTTRVIGIVPRAGGLSDTQVGCTDPKATNYNPSASYSNSFACTYGPRGEVLGASSTTLPEAPKAPEGPTQSPPVGQVLGDATSCRDSAPYLTKFAREGYKNDVDTVKKLQNFLNLQLGVNLKVDGIFGPMTTAALKSFQLLHKKEMLEPWGIEQPTGILYITTLNAINKIICSDLDARLESKDFVPFSKNPNTPRR